MLPSLLLLCAGCVSIPFDSGFRPGGGDGTLSISPSRVTASAEARLEMVYTAGPQGLYQGGGFLISLPVDPVHPYLGFTPPHAGSRYVRGHVRCSTVTDGESGIATPILEGGGRAGCVLERGRLAAGDSLVMHYWGLAPRISGRYALEAGTRISGGRGGDGLRVVGPSIEVLAGEARTLSVVAPSEAARDETLGLVVVALDHFGNRAESYTGTIQVSLGGDERVMSFTLEDGGIVRMDGFRLRSDGFHRAEVTEIDAPEAAYRFEARSNPIRVVDPERQTRVLWGDLHFHARGDDTSQERAFAHAREVSRLDFAASSQHVVAGFGEKVWQRSREAASRFDAPGVFAAFAGYHWRDRLVIMDEYDGPLVSGDDRLTDEPAELAARIPAGSLVVALGSPPESGAVAAAEIYSWRNREDRYVDRPSRFEPDAAWLTGASLPAAVVASSATHWGNPGTVDRTGLEPGAGGLTAVRAGGAGREEILDALRSGRAWATTGARIYVALEREGRRVRAVVAGTQLLEEVSLVLVEPAGSSDTALLDEPVEQIDTVIPLPAPEHRSFCFLRVRQADGEMAWSSPIPMAFDGRDD